MGKKSVTSSAGKYIKFTIYLVIVILLNLAINLTPPGKMDLTKNHLFSISKASKEAVKTLEEQLTIKVFFSDNLPAPYNTIKPYLRDLLKEYADQANRKYFSYEFIDVGGSDDSDSEEIQNNRTLAADYQITAVNVEAVDQDAVSFKRAYMGIAIIHGDIIEKVTPIQSTNGMEFKITSTIQKMNNKISALLALEENIQVKLYLSSTLFDLLASTKEIPNTVKGVVEKLDKQNYGKLDYVFIDPSADPGKAAEAGNAGVYSFTSGGSKYYGDILLSYEGRQERIGIMQLVPDIFGRYVLNVTSADDLETIINDAVSTMIGINEKIGYLTSNGTRSLQDQQQDPYSQQQPVTGLTNFKQFVEDGYSIEEIDLEQDKGIPEGINCIVIAGPEGQFTDYQLYQLDQFLMQGKSIAVFLDGKKIIYPDASNQFYGYQPPPQFDANQTGLEALLEHYGVTVEPSFVFDENGFEQRDPNSGITKIYWAPQILNDKMNLKLNFIRDIRGLLVARIAPLTVDEEKLKENNITPLRLFSSSDKSWIEQDLPVDQQSQMMMTPPFNDDEKSSYPLAYILEGRFTSYFAGKPIPEKPQPADTGEEEPEITDNTSTLAAGDVQIEDKLISTGEPGKIFVIGSAFVLDNNLLSSEIVQNVLFYLNILDYMNNKEDYAVMRTKLQQYNPLNPTSSAVKSFTKIFNIAIIPVLFILVGVLVFFQRKAKKIKLQQMFAKTNVNREEERA